MASAYDTPLYFLAFDHRSSFERGLFGATPPLSPEVRDGIAKAKEIIFDANRLAVRSGAPSKQAGVLVDEEFGSAVARRARKEGVPLAMPVERSGQDEFDFQYGDQFTEHIEAFDPTFVKVLVRFNSEGDADLNRRQTERLARLSEWLRSRDRTFLFELLVPATTAQLDSVEGHQQDYDRQLRPRLVVQALAALQAGGVEPDIWKVEGLDSPDNARAVVGQARAGGRDGVICIVLGRGADWDSVVRWLQVGASVPGFEGFAVGRTLWHDALVENLAGRSSDAETAQVIATRYREAHRRLRRSCTGTDRRRPMTAASIRLMLADVDGTLVTQDKILTDAAIGAVHRLREADILFAITSGRPPRGMAMLIEPLDLQTPIAAFNGGLLVNRDMTVIEQRVVPEHLVGPIAALMASFDLSVWLYRGADWYVPDLKGPHVDREAWTVKFDPKVMTSIEGLTGDVAKIVGVSDDHDAVAKASAAAHERFGNHVTAAASQPYYLDVTHPDANKGAVAKYLARRYKLSTDEIATIGDMPNDVLMFAHSGLSIAMGNADSQVQRAARRVTETNEKEGFAAAVDRFVLPAAAQPSSP